MTVCVLSLFVVVLGVFGERTDGCSTPLSISHDSLLVEYGDPVELNCSISTKPSQYQLGWESSINSLSTDSETSVVWRSSSLIDWDVNRNRIYCYLTEPNTPQCKKTVHLVLYKRPDSVKISSESDVWSEDQMMTLKCEVQNVGPLQNLIVRWIRTDQNNNTKKPVSETSYGSFSSSGKQEESGNVTATLEVTARRDEDGVQYRCVVLLNLDLQHPQVGQSELQTISVHYKPTIVQRYTDTISVTKGDSLTLNCSAHGNPSPQYVWSSPDNQILTRSSIFTIDSVQSGDQYSCTASNTEGSDSVTVRVNVVVDYWLIIIICAAVAVVLLVTGFCIWCCMYYRYAHMGHYFLTSHGHNANGAHSDVEQNCN